MNAIDISHTRKEQPKKRKQRHVHQQHNDIRKQKLGATNNHLVTRPFIHHKFYTTTVTSPSVETGNHSLKGLEFEPIVDHLPDIGDVFNGAYAKQMIDNLLDLEIYVVSASPLGESTSVVCASPMGKSPNISSSTTDEDTSLDRPGTPNFQSNNDDNEDQSSTEDNELYSEEEAGLDGDSSCKGITMASLIREEVELTKAVEYVD